MPDDLMSTTKPEPRTLVDVVATCSKLSLERAEGTPLEGEKNNTELNGPKKWTSIRYRPGSWEVGGPKHGRPEGGLYIRVPPLGAPSMSAWGPH